MSENTNKQNNMTPSLQVKIDKLSNYEGNKVKAFATVTIANSFAIHGVRIINGEKGLFVAMPTSSYQKDGKTEYRETFHPVSAEARAKFNEAVLNAYEKEIAQVQNDDLSELEYNDELPFSLN